MKEPVNSKFTQFAKISEKCEKNRRVRNDNKRADFLSILNW